MSNEPFKYQKETTDFIWQNILNQNYRQTRHEGIEVEPPEEEDKE